jgi:putative hydrolase of the HAD superfamily
MCKKVVCFDLDDTLYKEIDFVESAYREIAVLEKRPELLPKMMGWQKNDDNVFSQFNKAIGKETPISEYLNLYRSHYPTISLPDIVEDTLNELKHREIILGLITDGRSISQRNKIKALGLDRWFDNENIIISEETKFEKTEEPNFRYFVKKYRGAVFAYVGDNPKKDFIVPNRLGWRTVMLKDDGRNIHKQEAVSVENLPQITITGIEELLDFVK